MKTNTALFISKFFLLAGLYLLLFSYAQADTVVYRVNAGGAALTSTPNWSVDTSASPSPFVNATATGNRVSSTTATINLTDPSLSGGAPPMSLFQTERWDPASGSEMQWNFPATAGSNYQIRLYFAETYVNAQKIGGRIFDVIVEGNVVLNDYDIFAEVGANKGVMKAFTVTPTDANLDIDFGHVVENPAIKGIEIILLTSSGSSTLSASPTSVTFGSVAIGSTGTQTVQLTNQGAAGASNIVISSATINGTNASNFSSNFSGNITLTPGQSTTVSLTCTPSGATGAKTASVAFAYNGGSAATLSVPLTCNAVFGGSSGVLGASPTSLNFGSVTTGTSSAQTVQLTNQGGSGAQNITISGVSLTGTNASQFSSNFSGSVTLTPGQSTSINVTFAPTGTSGARTATLAVSHNGTSTSPLNIGLSGNASSSTSSTAIYRVNAGGPALTATPNWSIDTQASPSTFVNAVATTNRVATATAAVSMTHASLSGDPVPMSLFQSERWDPSSGSEMQWTFPLPAAGSYAVDLYFAETYPGTQSIGARVFDVSIEGSIVLDNYDIFADVGGYTGVKKTFNITTTDTNLNINFGHVTQNPIVKGIQIRQLGSGSGNPGVLAASATSLDFGSLVLGASTTRQLTLTNQGGSGAPSITVSSANITGTNSTAFTSNFGPVTLAPGQSTTVTFTFSSSGTVGSKTATAAFVHNASGTASPINIPLTGTSVSTATIGFGKSLLQGATGLSKPTSLQFGPDGKLYVAQQNGLIRVYTVARSAANVYTVTATQNITLIQSIPNHDDNGALNASVNQRLVTGLAVAGTPFNPVIYVTSSDPRIGGGSSGTDLNLDTNSGIVSRLTWNGTQWVKLDLVRGLPRSEENHAPNGIAYDSLNNDLYIPTGGNTNHGAPSNNFAGLPEYAYSTALLKIDLDMIGNTTYDLPTLDDQDRAGTNDANDPFGGNDGKNQARLVQNGPVTIYASGFRNAYDVVLTGFGNNGPQFWTIDNGGNAGWGDIPVNEGPNGNCTNGLSEPGTTDLDQLHFISGPNTYFGHPNPTRGNAANTFNPANPQSPVQFANPVECDYRAPITQDGALTTFPTSTNGLAQYLTNNFGGAMNGNLLAAGFDNRIYRIILNSTSTGFISKEFLFSTVGGGPLDVIALDTLDPFPGTIWVADYGANTIVVFEPSDFNGGGSNCTGADSSTLDEDNDNYNNADEIDNGTDPCSAADVPPDWDKDGISNLNDPNDDNDSLNDTVDPFAIDANNGSTTNLPVFYPWENDAPNPGGLLNLGFTGLMTNQSSNYESLFDANGMTTGGAAGVVTVDAVPEGDALGAGNNQQYAFQFGINVNQSTPKFTAHTRIISPFAGLVPADFQSMGLFIGNGNQNNYFKIVTAAGGGVGAIQAGVEINGTFTNVAANAATLPGPGAVDLYLTIDPSASTVQAAYTITTGNSTSALIKLGGTQNIPSTWLTGATKLAVGIISTSRGPGATFPATWDFIEVASPWVTMPSMPVALGEVAGGVIDNHMYIVGEGNNVTLGYDLANNTWDATNSHAPRPIVGHHHGAEVFNNRFYLIGGLGTNVGGTVQSYNPSTNAWTTGPTAPFLAGSSATALIGGKIYFAGGIVGSNTTNQVAAFDPAANAGAGAWSALLAPMPQGVNHAAAATDGSRLYVFGGRTGGNTVSNGFNYVQIYNPATNNWESSTTAGSTIPPLPQARGGMGKAVYFNGEFYVIGGETSNGSGATANGVYNRVDIYNPTTKTWRLGSTMPTARHGIFPLLYGDKIHVAGGGTSSGNSQSAVHERNDPRFDQN